MNNTVTIKDQLPAHMEPKTEIGQEISITGKWVPTKNGILFLKSKESKEMRAEWVNIHEEAAQHDGILSTEVNHAIGQDAVLVHHVFNSESSLLNYFSSTASKHAGELLNVAKPGTQLIRGETIE